jgi:ATP-dependent Lon protease
MNPVFLLDEVDKLKKDYKGDPASTLLDILDVSQNKSFIDNYVDEEVDLSQVLFILTANEISSIPSALLDRLEIINLNGYSFNEKKYICENYLIPNILKSHGLSKSVIKFESDAINKIINLYTNENGVRELERCISKIIRKVITSHIKSSRKIVSVRIRESDLVDYLENPLYLVSSNSLMYPGMIRAVACSSYGGISLNIEVSSFKGTGKVFYTGSLSDIVKESIDVSIGYIKSNYKYFRIDEDYFTSHDIHVHFTDSSICKDGPSAGVCITTAILSLLKNKVIDSSISMTGEITLKGQITRVGSIKEKSIACARSDISKLFIPNDNMGDVSFIGDDLKDVINYIGVSDYKEIYEMIFD